MTPPKVIPDLEFIPLAYGITRRGMVEPLWPAEYAIVERLQRGPATTEEILAASGLSSRRSLRVTIAHLRHKLGRMGVVIPSANQRYYYALARARE